MPSSPMSGLNSFQTFALEQLGRAVPAIRYRRMFGGVGIYSGDTFFALIHDDAVYFKTDTSTRIDFVAREMKAFHPSGDAGAAMNYHQLPEDVLENPDDLRAWAAKAIAVARLVKKVPRRRS